MNFDRQLEAALEIRRHKGLYRSLNITGDAVDFCSNDYLGFARCPKLQIERSQQLNGATGSRLISGHCEAAETAEAIVASFHQREAALVFNSGYAANTGLLSAIAGKDDLIITDRHVHASILDGVILSRASHRRFRHNDMNDLGDKLKNIKGRTFVVVESVYSMDGDEAPLPAIAALCEQYNAMLIVDEAHATGVYGEHGEGLVAQYHLQSKVLACVHTFGKALGLHGAAVTGSKILKAHLINSARPFIYSTALPPAMYEQIGLAYQLLRNADRPSLFNNISYFSRRKNGFPGHSFLNTNTPIQGLLIGDNKKTKEMATHLSQNGISAKAILSPTVQAGTERIRICLHSYNTQPEIDQLLRTIHQFQP